MNFLTKIVDEDFDITFSNENNFKDLKRLRLWDKRFDEISRDIGVFLIFLFFLYFVSFSNLSDSSYIYNELFHTTFVQAQSPTEKGLDDVKMFKLRFLDRRCLKNLFLFSILRFKMSMIFGLGLKIN
jgi:hypothetical protein